MNTGLAGINGIARLKSTQISFISLSVFIGVHRWFKQLFSL